jgi:hypothetical protein
MRSVSGDLKVYLGWRIEDAPSLFFIFLKKKQVPSLLPPPFSFIFLFFQAC